MKKSAFLVIAIFMAPGLRAQRFVRSEPAGRQGNMIVAISGGIAAETGATVRDLVTFRDRNWTLLTIAQIAATSVDAKMSVDIFRRCPTCEEMGLSRFAIGRRPDAHKYAIAGLVEIGIEAVAAHYLRNHGPIRKWYWRYVRALPQTFSLYEHVRGGLHSAGLNLTCHTRGLNCF